MMPATTRSLRWAGLLGVAAWLACAAPLADAQTPAAPNSSPEARLRSGRDELARARGERSALEAQLRTLLDTAHDLRAETAVYERQAAATARVVKALDDQLGAIHSEVDATSTRYDAASRDLARQQVGLRRRLVEIYKRGPLGEAEALLSAASFGDLVARYKYLHELALRDRTFVRRVEQLRNNVAAQRALLVRLQIELARNRDDKAAEEARLRGIEAQRGQSLAQVEGRAARTRNRITQVAHDEARLSSLLAGIEATRRRREAAARLAATRAAAARERSAREAAWREAARITAGRTNGRSVAIAARPTEPAAAASPPALAIAASAPTSFTWPLRGPLLYRFGRVVGANNTATRWNGVGIEAAVGTPVHAAAAGRVAVAQSIGTYGQTVILQHEGGDYSVYGSLGRVDVQVGETVQRGQVLGTVGAADPDLPAHLHFELRPQGHATDPLAILGGR